MGEVLAGAIVLLVVVCMLVGGAVGIMNYWRKSAPDIESATYRNHQAMARWIEHALDDDMERACIASNRQQTARRLLAAFYKEKEQG